MTPQAPSPYETASAQSGANVDATIASSLVNNMNQKSPFGSVSYNQKGYKTFTDSSGKKVQIPNYESVTTLSPEQQALYDRQVSAGRNLGDLAVSQSSRLNTVLNSPFNPGNLPARPDGGVLASDYSADRRRVEDALMSRFNEDFTRDEAATENKLLNQGLTRGSEAWGAEMQRLDRARNDARSQATLAGGQEQSRLAGLDVQRLNAQQGLRGTALQEEFALRNQPINEISALMSGGQVTAPTFASPYQQGVGSVPVGDYINQDYQQRLNTHNANMSGLFGLGSSLASGLFLLSDRRAKTDIKKVGETGDGQNLYSYRYKGSPETHVGLMAQEVAERHPEAVAKRPDGLFAVDYSKALAEAA